MKKTNDQHLTPRKEADIPPESGGTSDIDKLPPGSDIEKDSSEKTPLTGKTSKRTSSKRTDKLAIDVRNSRSGDSRTLTNSSVQRNSFKNYRVIVYVVLGVFVGLIVIGTIIVIVFCV
ncbi:unnamed protein product [Bursaphelenchus okinawaensis]|uniref:Uncharacterized protein n=1 Tax=Bursaphelenchus okinawaensis TaxID=465554 RepID=A0A811L8M2_9BILA|nr:unnamed protein product [Bursaphelenchus okinawaensis]CAG9119542.1 unnamed protein product [Bursaphelenchus okinawaensis]